MEIGWQIQHIKLDNDTEKENNMAIATQCHNHNTWSPTKEFTCHDPTIDMMTLVLSSQTSNLKPKYKDNVEVKLQVWMS